MRRYEVLEAMVASGVIAVVRGDSPQKAVESGLACLRGGISLVEIAFTVPFAHKALEEFSTHCEASDVIVGAGSVLDAETARIAILNGAQFVVSPSLNSEMIYLCHRYGVVAIPGCQTVSEVVTAMEMGCEVVKYFPSSVGGYDFIKALKGPLPQAMVMATGGVSFDNAAEWIESGAVCVGVGGKLTSVGVGETVADIEKRAAKLVKIVASAKSANGDL